MKKLFFAVLHGTGVTRLVGWLHRRQTVFLCYHSVTRLREAIPHELKLHLPLALFAAHLDYLQRHCHVIPLAEYLAARREGRRLPDRSVVLTFDDGTRNFLTVVAPLLVERNLPATAFIITKCAAEREGFRPGEEWALADDYMRLSWAEVRALAATPGIEIGSHSHTHKDLTTAAPEEVEQELRESYEAVVEHTGEPRPALAYPYGRTSEAARETARALGYSCALTSALGGNDARADLFELRRVVVAGDDDVATFAARVCGVTWLYGRARAFFAGTRGVRATDAREREAEAGASGAHAKTGGVRAGKSDVAARAGKSDVAARAGECEAPARAGRAHAARS
jgi:peptidoglycan/xylan/chitin deacetylase (PgdA/CDA1 family)